MRFNVNDIVRIAKDVETNYGYPNDRKMQLNKTPLKILYTDLPRGDGWTIECESECGYNTILREQDLRLVRRG